MNLVLDENNYNINNIFFYEPVKNTVMDDSKFIRIIYSDEFVTLNGLYLKINMNDKNTPNYLEQVERDILSKFTLNKNIVNKNKSIKIKDQLLFLLGKNNLDSKFLLKISGIWETNLTIGLTYKFISIN
jgi:hypothetical protein